MALMLMTLCTQETINQESLSSSFRVFQSRLYPATLLATRVALIEKALVGSDCGLDCHQDLQQYLLLVVGTITENRSKFIAHNEGRVIQAVFQQRVGGDVQCIGQVNERIQAGAAEPTFQIAQIGR